MRMIICQLPHALHTAILSQLSCLQRLRQPISIRGQSRRNMGEPAPATSSGNQGDDPIVQYIVLRRDLWAEQGWPLGPLIAQACHASVAALWLSRDDPDSQQYVSEAHLDSMHKVGPRYCNIVSDHLLTSGQLNLEVESVWTRRIPLDAAMLLQRSHSFR